MSTSKEFAEFVADQVHGFGPVQLRKMFGEYCLYVQQRPICLICDDQVFFKRLPDCAELEAAYAGVPTGLPYEGASPWYLVDIEDRAFLDKIVPLLLRHVPIPAPKRRPQVQPGTDFPWAIGKPATRALVAAGFTRLEQLHGVPASELLALHGVGPRAVDVLRAALASSGWHLT